MYFQESEAIAAENPGLLSVIEQVDELLATIFVDAPLRPTDFSCKLECNTNQVIAFFDLLTEREVLVSEKVVECTSCQTLMPAASFRKAMADEDDFECSSCARPFRRITPVCTVYRMTPETLDRPRPAVATPDVESALWEFDQWPNVFRRLGQIWVIKYDGKMILMEDAKGMPYLARILAEPDRRLPAAHLLAASAGIDENATKGSSGELLDDQAFATYKQRYGELQEDLEEAERNNDAGRIAQLQSDLETFGLEIARATGLGGRKRENTDAEKIRKNVSNAVTRAIDSIRAEHERLGRHLRNSVSSGLTFEYTPEHDPGWLI